MKKNYVVGNVIAVNGIKITILMNESSNLELFHYDGMIYNGISIGSYVGIIRGSNKIIGRVEREFLEDKDKDLSSHEFSRNRFERHLEISLLGYIYREKFEFGIKAFPMIFNEVVLLTEEEIGYILGKGEGESKYIISIGKNVPHNIPVLLSWDRLFNTHIGIFGNTGSGKSNTLTKIYTELFNREGSQIGADFNGKSKFIIIDFNGEYIKSGVLRADKQCINLSTRRNDSEKIILKPKAFWDIETLSILYSATEKTQRPFLDRAVQFFLDEETYDISTDRIIEGLGSAFYNVFKENGHKETLFLLNKSLEIINVDPDKEYRDECHHTIDITWLKALWNAAYNTYYLENPNGEKHTYLNRVDASKIKEMRENFEKVLKSDEIIENIKKLTVTDKLKIAVNSYFIYCLAYGKVNFEHINPLIQRIEARSSFVEKTISVCQTSEDWKLVNVISFRDCNAEAKKMLSLLIAKQLYELHKEHISDTEEISATVHLIIDEAHNILSTQSIREAEMWKDYRLEVFEEIIKEGRKFGFYLTLASQRPWDISATIMSQLHNYFIHRLVNEQDLKMIANTVNSLDSISKSQIPNLSPGQCVITGTSFSMPLLVQVDKLTSDRSPSSENADLVGLWKKE